MEIDSEPYFKPVADQIFLDHWSAPGDVSEIMDFDTAQDSLILLYDGAQDAPEVEITETDKDGVFQVQADGILVASVHSAHGLTVSDISLVAQE